MDTLLALLNSRTGKAMAPHSSTRLENPMDGGAWWATVHGVTKSQTRLSDFAFTFHFHALEKEMATHSSVLAWRIPGTGEPGGLPSMRSHRVRYDWNDLAAAAANSRRASLEEFSYFSKVIQLGSGGAGLQTWALRLQSFKLLTVMLPSSPYWTLD